MTTPVYDTEFATNEFTISGEIKMMEALSTYKMKTIFDVGANIGEWSRMARKYQPEANIHLFEPMPPVFNKLLMNNVLDNRMWPNNAGMSEQSCLIELNYSADNDRLSSALHELFRPDGVIRPAFAYGGKDYCDVHDIDLIDMIKIDTEGWEMKVLKGFDHLLKDGRVALIQFEYGYANILTKDLLIDYYRYLHPYGYMIGIQTPEGVVFRNYDLLHENFNGPNYVAVHNSNPDLIAEIQYNV
jgi:FkbM family methyltransferase